MALKKKYHNNNTVICLVECLKKNTLFQGLHLVECLTMQYGSKDSSHVSP